MFYLMCPAARTFGSSKLLTCLFSHAIPDGGLSALADTQAKNSSPSCILPMSITPILLPFVPSGSIMLAL